MGMPDGTKRALYIILFLQTLHAIPPISKVSQVAVNVDQNATSFPFLSPLLRFNNGTKVDSEKAWGERRAEVQDLLTEFILGAWPSKPIPPLTGVKTLNSTTLERGNGATSTFYRLSFDTSAGGTTPSTEFDIEVLAPAPQPGISFPLFLTQWNHREWALIGLSRNYVSVVYPGADTRDAAPAFQHAYPNATMMLIMARAYVVSRTLDGLLGQAANAMGSKMNFPNITDGQVCITGHSRNGKQSLIAAAFDERITAVMGSSPGAPIASPYSFSSHNYYGEGPDAGQAGHWWLKQTEEYAAHPERLPMDGHGVLASIAPRHCAVSSGWTDHEGDIIMAGEYGQLAAAEVYRLFNATSRLRLFHRPGDHHGFLDTNSYFDFFDVSFNRLPGGPVFPLSWAGQHLGASVAGDSPFVQTFLTPAGFDWEVWFQAYGSEPHTPAPPSSSAPLQDRIAWVLQSYEPTLQSVGTSYAEDGSKRFSYPSVMMGADYDTWGGINRQPLSFGDYVTGNLFWPNTTTPANTSLPVVIWLHPFSYNTGYVSCNTRDVIPDLVRAGFAVLAYDQIGFGTRMREGGTTFYARHGGRASLFGHMVRDAMAAIDLLECLTAENRHNQTRCGTGENHTPTYPNLLNRIPDLDASTLLIAGYSLGGSVALHVAALDSRVAAVASFAGFTPMRQDSNDRSTGGLRRLYDLHALLPRLGLFQGNPLKVPYDYDELLAALAPRPTLVYTPVEDRDATYADVCACVDAAREAWEPMHKTKLFNHTVADTYTDMGVDEVKVLIDWARHTVTMAN